jgi:hypothetical protein
MVALICIAVILGLIGLWLYGRRNDPPRSAIGESMPLVSSPESPEDWREEPITFWQSQKPEPFDPRVKILAQVDGDQAQTHAQKLYRPIEPPDEPKAAPASKQTSQTADGRRSPWATPLDLNQSR